MSVFLKLIVTAIALLVAAICSEILTAITGIRSDMGFGIPVGMLVVYLWPEHYNLSRKDG